MSSHRETISPIERLTEAELEAYNILVPEHKANSIKPELFDYKDVESDLIEISRLEAKIAANDAKNPRILEQQKRGELFEAILSNQIELSDWFGPNATTIVPSRYDDIKNDVDSIVEFESEGFFKHLGLSIDATTHVPSIAEKIDNIRKDISHGHLTNIKYFISEASGHHGRLNNIPKVVVGAEPIVVRELAGIWLNLEKTRAQMINLEKETGKDYPEVVRLRGKVKTFKNRLAEHRIQFQILEEVRAQLEYFIKLAGSEQKEDLAQKYQETINTINEILDSKTVELPEEERAMINNDNIYQAILKEVA